MSEVKEVIGVPGGLLDMEEAAHYLAIRKATLYAICMRKQIPHVKIGRLNRFRKQDLDDWVQARVRKET